MKKIFIILIILAIPAVAWLMQPGYFPMHDDLQAMRQLQMTKCFEDGQIPCRWVPDMGYSYGYPLFNFYPPLPYYLGQIFHTMGFSYIDIVKILGVIVLLASVVTIYLLASEFFGSLGGALSSMLYLYAPYHSVDFYVRAAVNESWALVWFPLIYWTTYKLIESSRFKWVPLVSLSVAALMLSHNPMLMIFVPTYLSWIVFWWWKFKSLQSFKNLSLAAVWAFGLAAFFTLPVVFEQQYVSIWTLTSGYFNYLAHFLDVKQMFLNINWGYGSSELGPVDSMSFAIGYMQWIIPAIILVALPFSKKLKKYWALILFSIFYFLISLFLTHSKSTPLWQFIKPLEILQFPWRFLTLVIFFASFISGVLKPKPLLLSCSLALILLLNANYFRPREWWPNYTDYDRFTGKNWQLMLTSAIFDYLPVWAYRPPANGPTDNLEFLSAQGSFTTLEKKSNRQKYEVEITKPGSLIIQTYYFPGWKVWVDGKLAETKPLSDPLRLGRIIFDVSSGQHQILVKFTDTPIRTIGNILSLLSWLGIGFYFVRIKHE
ncbi:glycosyltransferase family 39 protein [Candidatus Amesbacteria bacterium]|nr:glycosyltransferase family 39 protein [Candidatus Amesbacteria bacterium]